MIDPKYRPGEAVAHWRKEQNMTRKALAQVSGLEVTTIERIEKTNRGTWHNIVTLFDTIGLTVVR